MNKPISLALLVIGIILVVYGLSAGNSFGSGVSKAVTGTPTDKSMGLLIAGILAGIVGLFGLVRGTKA